MRPLAARESSPLQLLARDRVRATEVPASSACAGTGEPGLALPMVRAAVEKARLFICRGPGPNHGRFRRLPLVRARPPISRGAMGRVFVRGAASGVACKMYDELRIPRITCSMESFQELTGYIEGTVPFFDHVLDHGDLEGGARRLLALVFPDWFEDELDGPGHVGLTQCTDGITNKRTARCGRPL